MYDNCHFDAEQIERALNNKEDMIIKIDGHELVLIMGDGYPIPIGHVVQRKNVVKSSESSIKVTEK